VVVVPNSNWRTSLPPIAPIDQRWWSGFGDPVLTALVETALANNPDIALAAARVREARAQQQVARAALFPTLDAGGGVQEARSVGPLGTASTSTSAQPLLQTSYEIDLFGRVRETVSAARSNYLASQAARDAAALSVAGATATGYITLRGLDARLAIAEETVRARAEALRIARNRARVGYTSDLELRQAEAEFRSATQLVPQLQLAATRQENALAVLIGTTPRATVRGRTLAELRPISVPALLPSELLRHRPDIAQAELTVAASDATLAASRAQFLPRLNLTGSTGLALSTALANPISLWSIGASVLAPLFEGGRLTGQLNVAAARRDQALLTYRRTTLTAFREVEDSLAALQRLGEQRRELAAQRAALAEALRHATNRYEAGYTSYLEQLDAQRALLATELSLVQARTDELNAAVALFQALGGGWTSTA
jgi:NodT family efflux transporter outer membrane factor (OMF) lipoprotein